MSQLEETKRSNGVEDAKIDNEPTDEREAEAEPRPNEVNAETVGETKQIHMKVDVDAPWKDRMWEGME